MTNEPDQLDSTPKPSPAIDWPAINRAYRAGIKSERAISREFGITRDALRTRAESEGWERDLSERIRARAESKLADAAFASVAMPNSLAADGEVVEANAEMQKNIILSHRTDIQSARAVWHSLMTELQAQSANAAELADCAQRLMDLESGQRSADKGEGAFARNGQMAALAKSVNSAISLHSRSQTAHRLCEALKTLLVLERMACGVEKDKVARPEDLVCEALKALYAERT